MNNPAHDLVELVLPLGGPPSPLPDDSAKPDRPLRVSDDAESAVSHEGYGVQTVSYAKAALLLLLIALICIVIAGFGMTVYRFAVHIGLSFKLTVVMSSFITTFIGTIITYIISLFCTEKEEKEGSRFAEISMGFLMASVIIGAILFPVTLFMHLR